MGNILWLASYPKSGNTWLRAFLANLVATPFGIAAGLDQVLRSVVHLVFVGFQLRLDFIESVP